MSDPRTFDALKEAEAENARLRSELEDAQRAKYGTPCGCEAWMQTARDAEKQLAEARRLLERHLRRSHVCVFATYGQESPEHEDCDCADCESRAFLAHAQAAPPKTCDECDSGALGCFYDSGDCEHGKATPPSVLPPVESYRVPIVCPACGNQATFTTCVPGAKVSIVECSCGYRPA